MSKPIYLLSLILIPILFFSCSQNQQPVIQNKEKAIKPVSVKRVAELLLPEKGGISLHRISSKILGYDLQYWVHLPEGYQTDAKYPTFYITDGL